MTRIQSVQRDRAPEAVAATLDAVKTKLGMVPNLIATFANAPAVLAGYLGFSDALAGGRLTAKQREVIALAVGQANKCQYCVSAHTMIGKGAGLSDAAILDARGGRSDDPQTNAIVSLTLKIVAERGAISDEDLRSATAAGLDHGLIIEIVGNVAVNVLTNYTNRLARTVVDFPAVAL